MPWAVWPVLLTALPAYLTGVLGMTTPFKCTVVVLGLCVIATICGCLSSLKWPQTMPWLITTTSFIWGICNAGTLLYTLSALKSNLLGSTVLWMAEASGKIPENATLYCVVAVLILICCTGLHTLIYLMKGVDPKV